MDSGRVESASSKILDSSKSMAEGGASTGAAACVDTSRGGSACVTTAWEGRNFRG